jgi:hypothetical protein
MLSTRPYLIHRGSFKDIASDADITGIDSLLSFDYMGSSEFEFGGLPKSLRRIVASLSDYATWTMDMRAKDGRALILFCKPDDREELFRLIPMIRDRSHQLKERAGLDDALSRTNFWWDIENDWMMWLDEENTPSVKLALAALFQRWIADRRSPATVAAWSAHNDLLRSWRAYRGGDDDETK